MDMQLQLASTLENGLTVCTPGLQSAGTIKFAPLVY